MVNLAANILAVAPTGLWENIIFTLSDWVKNYALAIILLTLFIKLILLPVDYFQRRGNAKMQAFQEKNAQKMQEIQTKYPDKNIQNQKLGELYKKEGFNPMGSCLTMIISMAISIAVFFTLFGSLNGISAYKITNQYEQLQTAYIYDYVKAEYSLTDEQIAQLEDTQVDAYILEIASLDQTVEENIVTLTNAQLAVKLKYEEVKESFLWIKNVWIPDSPIARAIADFDTYAGTAGLKLEGEEREKAEQIYNAVMSDLEESEGVNGYFILAVLAAVSTFLSQYFATKRKKKENQNFYEKQNSQTQQQQSQAMSGKVMLFVFPIIMLFFTLSYNSIFAIYIVVSQLVAAATAPLITKLIQVTSKKKESK